MSADPDDAKQDLTEIVRQGAAMDGAQAEGDFAGLPRVLRYALNPNGVEVAERVASDVATLAPHLSTAVATWASTIGHKGWADVAAMLDDASVRLDEPMLRGLADVVRMLSMTTEDVRTHSSDALRVIAALAAAAREAPSFSSAHVEHLAQVDLYRIGWSHLASGERTNAFFPTTTAHAAAYEHGRECTLNLVARTEETIRDQYREKSADIAPASAVSTLDESFEVLPDTQDFLIVCPAIETKIAKTKDALKGHEHIVGKLLFLTPMPDIADVRGALVFEYPYAVAEIDRLLSPLVGQQSVHMPPTIIVGPPGGGKTRLLRRLSEELDVTCWRTDGARADGNTFGGTDRRWWSTEPCHPLLAVSRARTANPFVLIDEVDKAATRTDHGRLWDAMLPFLERETASAYPDPCLQVDLDLSAVSYVMTANSISGLPAPLIDRCRVIQFPEPEAGDLTSLLPALLRDHATDLGLNVKWVEPLSADERAIVGRHWRGGSVRRLRGVVDTVLRGRDRLRPVH